MSGEASTQFQIANFTDLVSLSKQYVEVDAMDMVQDLKELKSLLIVKNIPFNSGNKKQYTSYSGQTYASTKTESSKAAKKSFVQGYTKTLTAVRYAAELNDSWEARNLAKDSQIIQKLESLGEFIPQRMAMDLTCIFSYCTASSYTDMDGNTITTTVADGNPLVFSAHTLRGDSSTTFSNVIPSNPQFSAAALNVAKKHGRTNTYSQFGEVRMIEFDTIVTTADESTVQRVQVLNRSTTDPNQNNSAVPNTFKGQFRHVVLPRLSQTALGAWDSDKEKYWGLVATTGSVGKRWQAYLDIYEGATVKAQDEDVSTDDRTLGVRGTWIAGAVGAEGFLWSTGLGA